MNYDEMYTDCVDNWKTEKGAMNWAKKQGLQVI